MQVAARMVMSECINSTRGILTSHTRLRDKIDNSSCELRHCFAGAFTGVTGHVIKRLCRNGLGGEDILTADINTNQSIRLLQIICQFATLPIDQHINRLLNRDLYGDILWSRQSNLGKPMKMRVGPFIIYFDGSC